MLADAGRSAGRIGAYLDDILFPCSRMEILRCAEDNEAPDAILDAIEGLPDHNYASIKDILAHLVAQRKLRRNG